jgi:DHA1 family multidrug resistance protein-like MFS transporter
MKMRSNIFNKFTSFSKIISDKNPNENNLWKRNLVFISLAQFMTMIAMSSLIPFMPFYIRELGITDLSDAKLWSGLVFAGPYFLSIIAAPIWGSVGDKYGRKIMIARAVFGLTIAVFLMGFVQTAGQLLALRIFQGAVSGMIAAALSFVSANTPENRSGWAIGILQGSLSAGQVVGPFIGGIISDAIGIRSVFFIVSGFIFVSGFLVLIFVKENKITSSGRNAAGFAKSLRYVFRHRMILVILLLIFLSQSGIFFTNPVFPFFVEELGVPKKVLSTVTGSLFAIIGFFSILFASYWGKKNDKRDFRVVLMPASFFVGALMILHLAAPSYLYLFPIRAVIGIFFPALIPTLYTALNRRAPISNKGGVMGIASSFTLLGSLLSFLTCGIVSSNFGIEPAFIISGGLLILVSGITFIIKKY